MESVLLAHVFKARIARRVGCCLSTRYNELRRGTVPQYTTDYRVYYRYFADTAQLKYDFWQSQKDAPAKLRNRDFWEKIETQIMSHKYKPIRRIVIGFSGIEKSCLRKKPRTILYFCHPYSSFECGSNENANRMIRRFIPKGKSMTDCSVEKVQAVNNWINNYPRKLFGGKPSQEMFRKKFFQRF